MDALKTVMNLLIMTVAAFNQDLSSGDASKVTDMKGNVVTLNQDLSSGIGDTSKVTDI
jgi:hypothetical protein